MLVAKIKMVLRVLTGLPHGIHLLASILFLCPPPHPFICLFVLRQGFNCVVLATWNSEQADLKRREMRLPLPLRCWERRGVPLFLACWWWTFSCKVCFYFYSCVCVSMCAPVFGFLQGLELSIRSSGAGVTNGCERANIGAET